MKKKIIIANWKLNGNIKFIKKYFNKIKKINNKNCLISIAPPIIYLSYIYKLIKNTNITLTSQNIDIHSNGSYTGEISGEMLKDINTKYVIIGHSERKKYHLENNNIILKKILITKQKKLIPIICIGENLIDFNKNKSKNVCKKQLKYLIKNYNINIFINSIIAYEPIWAIGTGENANITHINKITKFIKNFIKKYNKKISKQTIIIYGGSINIENYKKIIQLKNINGLLIGKSSLNIKTFTYIIKNIQK